MALTLRGAKGSPLTHDEMDANFVALMEEIEGLKIELDIIKEPTIIYVDEYGNVWGVYNKRESSIDTESGDFMYEVSGHDILDEYNNVVFRLREDFSAVTDSYGTGIYHKQSA